MSITALDISSATGVSAVVVTTVNICLGLLLAVRYDTRQIWPNARINVFAAHNWTAYGALVLIIAHPLILLAVKKPRWTLLEIALPLRSPVQPIINAMGGVALYLIVIVIVSSYFRNALGWHRWKTLHYLVYGAAIFIFAHGIFASPNLSTDPIEPIDGEKLVLEGCLLVVAVASCWAWRCHVRHRATKYSSIDRSSDRPSTC